MFKLDDLQQQATAIDAQYRRDLDTLAKRQDLSQLGKVEGAQYLDAVRRTAVQRLQDEARQRHEAALQAAQAAQRAQRAAEIENKRAVLGDVILADIYRRQIANSSGDELLTLLEESADGFEKMLVTELARAELSERYTMPNPNRADIQAWQQLQPEPAVDYELKQAGQRIEQLDLAKYRQSAGDRLNIDARYVPSPF